MQRVRLVATDLDGTLVPEGTTYLKPELAARIRLLKEKGIVFAAASGRQLDTMRELLREVEDDIIFISSNGAYVWAHGSVVSEVNLDRKRVRALMRYIRTKEGYDFMAATGDDGTYVEAGCDEAFLDLLVNGYKNEIIVVPDATVIDAHYTKFSVYNKNGIAPLIAEAKRLWSPYVRVMEAGACWIDFVDYRAEKGIALAGLQRSLGIKKEETMAFGDNLNDIGMLERAAYSYAIGGARREVKEKARLVAGTVECDGVYKVLCSL